MDRASRSDQPRPKAIPLAELAEPPEQQTPSIRRRQAFVADDRWVGYIETTPGAWSGWHHHGDTDTYLYVLKGQLEFEYGMEGDRLRFGAGDFAHMPHAVVHRERTLPGEPAEVVLVRIGSGPTVVNVKGPETDR
jgi:uncharacterized RmlC-like cupin family protein